ncbi:MAG: phosphoglycerate kinase [Desulforhabdus sp.]|nr:phosphoglycerate kinase [Desulforhabdus sp.]
MRTLEDVDLAGKRVFTRVDFNVPLDKQRRVTDDLRIRAVLPTINRIVENGGKAIIASHLGRPKGKVAEEFSLQPVGSYLSKLLKREVPVAHDCVGDEVEGMVEWLKDGDILLLENLRFHAGEEKNDENFSKQLAALTDVYVNDAFAVSHRAHASVHGITRFVPVCAAGYQLAKEVEYYRQAMEQPKRPVAVIIGGAKVSTKIGVLENLVGKVDYLLIGGAMANTFLKARGKNVGKSLVEEEHMQTAARFFEKAGTSGVKVLLPVDAVVAPDLASGDEARDVSVDEISAGDQILDVGRKTIEIFESVLQKCSTIVWNGPLGAFETQPFNRGTFALAEFLGRLDALTVIGGGDSAAAVKQAKVDDKMSYVSTGGGAFLEMLEGKTLPGIIALDECEARS